MGEGSCIGDESLEQFAGARIGRVAVKMATVALIFGSLAVIEAMTRASAVAREPAARTLGP